MQPAITQQAGMSPVAIRVLRLLHLYRSTAAIGLMALLFGHGVSFSDKPTVFVFVGCYIGLQIAGFRKAEWIWRNARVNLAALLVIDVVFSLVSATIGGSLLYVPALLPILVAHGWLLHDQHAFLHAAVVTIGVLALNAFDGSSLTHTAFIGIGCFAAAGLGAMLGRVGLDAVELADQRGADLAKLGSLNDRIVEDLDQGVLIVDRDGMLLKANPQGERWLVGTGAPLLLPQALMEITQPLAIHWANWKEGNTVLDVGGITLGSDENQTKVRARFVSVDLRRAGDTVVFLEDLAVAQVRAQQIKLAALGRLTANIAHEIRNPLSAIRQTSQLLGESEHLSGSAELRLTEMVEKNVKRIDRIVSNVLSLSKRDKVVTSAISLQRALPELIKDWQEQMKIFDDSVGLTIVGNLTVNCDVGQLEEILWNLLSNAWRHGSKSPQCLSIKARAGQSGRLIAIEVTDDGPGVPVEHRESIFEPFFSMSGSSGLGLYICRELAESNSGTLEITSYDKGAQFRLILPGRELE